MRFSQRYGFTPIKDTIQIQSMDDTLRVKLWNVLMLNYWTYLSSYGYLSYLDSGPARVTIIPLWGEHLGLPLDVLPADWQRAFGLIRDKFFAASWAEVYDFLEFVADHPFQPSQQERFIEACNKVLKEELSGWRFVDGAISPLTSEEQVLAIEDAVRRTDRIAPVRTHLETALRHLSDRRAPDYRNSVKESILAVEAICKIIAGSEKATLGQALSKIEKKLPIHGALKSGFDSLYGYTSDADGIRHALLEASSLDLEDALFFLVACSGFISYLIQKAAKVGIKLS
ncbi:MAG: hypothetical protein M1582_01570 [Actinobacteria bacterium]|nr:hypothetical protein [Actinomycetota bacterium]